MSYLKKKIKDLLEDLFTTKQNSMVKWWVDPQFRFDTI